MSAPFNANRLIFLGSGLILLGALGFYNIPGMIADDAEGSRLVNSIYCSVMTLTTVGYGDICPGEIGNEGRMFIVSLSFLGLGMFSGPIMDFSSSWTKKVPGGIWGATCATAGLGLGMFTILEGMQNDDALYFTVITGTTIGYGDVSPKTDIGKLATSIFAILVTNVMGGLLEPAKDVLANFCRSKPIESKSKEA
mmetsp:Transcript_39479/g.58002  ORF Transcript_39479/g.58002 Transcript_39479/m.58002 type:complete len:195 (+) Transcript_39479:168-752(+)|eukprot:CAMPEP_0195525858 /NCGR_PEP_ID=MMETSP0794_2-20130614/26519_1 /TAXON_ID=515487 /ORGANISM="Stephanopyxis turris, Strain CCMP 815" /LENGTH=194 /DNA_ID=CAMNT_0040656407 /DNA_START=163 /DNA_END=747 /DNA_ORIENTATION=-